MPLLRASICAPTWYAWADTLVPFYGQPLDQVWRLAGHKKELKCQPRPFMWGLISKISQRPFSWHPKKWWRFLFFLIRVSLPDWEFLKTYLHTFFNDSFFYSIAFCSAHTLVFLAKQHKKLFSPIGIFRTRNFTFWGGKSLLYLKKWHFRVNAPHFHHLEEQKNLFCFSQACFGLRAV